MLFKIIFVYIAGFLDILLGALVLFKNPRSEKNLSFFLFTLSIGAWSIGVASFLLATSKIQALYWDYLNSLSLITISTTFLHLSWAFSHKKVEAGKKVLWYSLIGLTLLGLLFPGFYIKEVIIHAWGKQSILGFGYYLLSFIYGILVSLGFMTIFLSFKNQHLSAYEIGVNRLLFYGLLLAIIFGSIFNWFFVLLNYYKYIWVGPYSLFMVLAITAYAITKHRLMDISVVISRTMAYVLTILSLGAAYLLLALAYRGYFSSNIDAGFLGMTTVYGILVGESFQRVRFLIQTSAEKAFLKGRYDYRKVLSRMSQKLAGCKTMGDITRVLEGDFKEEVEAKDVKLYLGKTSGDGFQQTSNSIQAVDRSI